MVVRSLAVAVEYMAYDTYDTVANPVRARMPVLAAVAVLGRAYR